MNEFRCCKLSTLKLGWLSFNLNIPLGPFLHLEKLVDHANDRVHLLLWILLDLVKQSSHRLAVVSNGVWYSIQKAELWDKMDFSSVLIGNKHWLVLVRDLHLILCEEVLGHRDRFSIRCTEECRTWILVKSYISDNVSLFGSVVCDHT